MPESISKFHQYYVTTNLNIFIPLFNPLAARLLMYQTLTNNETKQAKIVISESFSAPFSLFLKFDLFPLLLSNTPIFFKI